jgi:hypothetical protein
MYWFIVEEGCENLWGGLNFDGVGKIMGAEHGVFGFDGRGGEGAVEFLYFQLVHL